MTAQELWLRFCRCTGISSDTHYEAWQFGEAADRLAALTASGIKTATTSPYDLYEIEKTPLPKAGDYSVILDSQNEAVCVIRDTRVTVVPFSCVTKEHAYKEGEGDRSLAYYRKVHIKFIGEALKQAGLSFDENRLVVCEEYSVVYRADASAGASV